MAGNKQTNKQPRFDQVNFGRGRQERGWERAKSRDLECPSCLPSSATLCGTKALPYQLKRTFVCLVNYTEDLDFNLRATGRYLGF